MNKHRATAHLEWEFEADISLDELENYALENLYSLVPIEKFRRCHVIKIDKLKTKQQRIVLEEYEPEDILKHINGRERLDITLRDQTYSVRINSHRYFLFRSSRVCAACGLEGTKFLLEAHPNDKSPHFNLYGEEDGDLVLFTKDHIQPKSLGGEDRHSNYQTMCAVCNNLKGDLNLKLEAIAELRKLYNENRKHMPRRDLNQLLNKKKKELAEPHKVNWGQPTKGVILKVDIGIRHDGNQFVAESIYSSDPATHVACVGKGCVLDPQGVIEDSYLCPFNETTFIMPTHFTEAVVHKAS